MLFQNFYFKKHPNTEILVKQPKNLNCMLNIARTFFYKKPIQKPKTLF